MTKKWIKREKRNFTSGWPIFIVRKLVSSIHMEFSVNNRLRKIEVLKIKNSSVGHSSSIDINQCLYFGVIVLRKRSWIRVLSVISGGILKRDFVSSVRRRRRFTAKKNRMFSKEEKVHIHSPLWIIALSSSLVPTNGFICADLSHQLERSFIEQNNDLLLCSRISCSKNK